MRELVVQGMFRSGTTLLSRMLSVPPENLVVADPFVYFFKAYRNFHLRRHSDRPWTPDEPTSDHFLPRHPAVDRAILDADLSEEVPEGWLEHLVADIRTWKQEQHPKLCAQLDRLERGSFTEVYRQLIQLCVEAYGSANTTLAGTKLSWCEEYLPALGRAFPEMRFLLIVRDLRSIVASQESQTGPGQGKRPLLFYVRHWRKSVAFSKFFTERASQLRARTHLLKYEDLVLQPQESLRAACSKLGVDFQADMLRTALFRGASENGPWTPNSSFREASGKAGIYAHSIERWREVLSPDQVRSLEALAGPELAWMGYPLDAPPCAPREVARLDCEPPLHELAGWIRPFSCCDYLRDSNRRRTEFQNEERRRRLIESGHPPSRDELRLLPEPAILPDLRRAWNRYAQLAAHAT